MNYIGSKYSLLNFLEKGILERVEPQNRVFLDIFSGTGIVGWHFKQQGFQIVSNDIQYYAYCLNRALVQINQVPEFSDVAAVPPDSKGLSGGIDTVLAFLNALVGLEGFVYKTYCPGGTRETEFQRQYFSDENGMRCDAIRTQIERWREAGKLTEDEYFYLLASLIDAVDRVANTASIYGAFLKHIKKSAAKPLRLERVPVVQDDQEHWAHNCDGARLVERVMCDVLYMDPPYNHRQYCTNYHVLETIARYDRPEVYGVTGLRPYDGQKSDFCAKKHALPALEEMVRKTRARFVFLSYNSEGIMQKDDISSTLEKYGEVKLQAQDYSRFRADTDRENRVYKANQVKEYLFCLEKR